jgi:hypothetical protein
MEKPLPHSELASEREQLVRSVQLIERGWVRFRQQQEALADLHAHGRDTVQAERLLGLMSRMLIEWERHRQLIEDRIVYLEGSIPR